MKRREFITVLGGAAAAWPVAARAQQSGRVRRIGVLQPIDESDPEGQRRRAAFDRGLQKLGWAEGANSVIDYRWGGSDAERIRRYAAELVGLQPDVIWTTGALGLLPLKRATGNIPIVFTQITQGEFSMGGKLLEVLKELAPEVSRVAVILTLPRASSASRLPSYMREPIPISNQPS
jgi:putative ABC transport system substrate-binding protein